jgi:hypothetical protein
MVSGRTGVVGTDWQAPMSIGTGPTSGQTFNILLVEVGKPRLRFGNGSVTHSAALAANQAFVIYGRFFNQINHPERFRVGFTGQAVENAITGNTQLLIDNQEVKLGVASPNDTPFLGRLSELVLISEIPAGPQEADLYNAMGAFFGV